MNCTHRASGINLSRYDDQPEVAGGFRRFGQATTGRGTSNRSQTPRSAPCLRIIRHHPITTRSVITEISNLGDVLTRIWFRILQQKLKKNSHLDSKTTRNTSFKFCSRRRVATKCICCKTLIHTARYFTNMTSRARITLSLVLNSAPRHRDYEGAEL